MLFALFFLIALREGVEAALVVGIVLVYLNRTGRANLVRWVWGGVAAAVASSLAVAIALERWKVSEDGFEGVLLLVAAVFVVTMIVWMNRVARHLKTEIEKRVEKHAAKSPNSPPESAWRHLCSSWWSARAPNLP
jgi:high-affinity iron transporter